MDVFNQYKTLNKNRKTLKIINITLSKYKNKYIIDKNLKSKIAIIIPFREQINSNIRKNQLEKLVKHLNIFLKNFDIDYKFFIIKQNSYTKRFNRGKLLNIGFDIANKMKYNIFIIHDVDMIPDEYLMNYYLYIPKYPIHIAHPKSSVKYSYKNYIGGINIYSKKHYLKINGFPNDFWGWGGEDDAIYDRLAINNFIIIRPDKGKIKELPHEDLKNNKSQTNIKRWENRIDNIKNWINNGISNLKYKILNKYNIKNVYIYKVDI